MEVLWLICPIHWSSKLLKLEHCKTSNISPNLTNRVIEGISAYEYVYVHMKTVSQTKLFWIYMAGANDFGCYQ